jgi:uncharacterized cupredoxin-like copper-binding protein
MSGKYSIITTTLAGLVFAGSTFTSVLRHQSAGDAVAVTAKLSEWKVDLSDAKIVAGPVTFTVTNAGSIPHALEIEGQGIEQQTALLQPGSSATLALTLQPGSYEIYCPVGEDSHKKLGMETHLKVVGASGPTASGSGYSKTSKIPAAPGRVQAIQVTGGGQVIQILPGPFPFADSAATILKSFGDEKEGLESQAQNGPYSNNVTPIKGRFSLTAWDKGATRDSVDGVAEFTTRDQAKWKLVLDRVQTKDVPHHPRFGGVIMGLYYHGMTGVHTPLVPTINSAVALWAFGHLYKNDSLVTDNAMVHVMQLSRTRRVGDFKLDCWDCSKNKIEELQLQILPGKDEPKLDAPGGFLFVNWEKSPSSKSAG